MNLTGDLAPAITTGIQTLRDAIPADLTQAHDALADLESKLQASVSTDIDKFTATGLRLIATGQAAGQTLLGAPDLLSVGRALAAALIIGKQLELYAPAGPFIMRLGDAPK